jgi:hypothetical protein
MVKFFGMYVALLAFGLQAQAALPQCWSNRTKTVLPVDNQQVLRWKKETKNQFKDRARVAGKVRKIVLDRPTHTQFEVVLGEGPGESIELIYNKSFGALPPIQSGMNVDACGDYITTRGGRRPSPMGAILHWVHFNPGDRDGGKHEGGYLAIDGVVYGQERPRNQMASFFSDQFILNNFFDIESQEFAEQLGIAGDAGEQDLL